MPGRSIIAELYDYNDWANARILRLCEGLADEQLNATREMGFGSLRATLFHILSAERLWLDRWQERAWAPLATDPQGVSLNQLARDLRQVADERNGLLTREDSTGFARVVHYADSRGNPYAHAIGDLLLHVANHGIHHRAQALHFLKQFGRTVPAGLDYLFYKLARPDVRQSSATEAALRGYGLEVAAAEGREVRPDLDLLRGYFAYGDWAQDSVLSAARSLDDAALDQDFDLGLGTIRRNLLHIHDAERWWYRNWTEGTTPFERLPASTPLVELAQRWAAVSADRERFLDELSVEGAHRVVEVQVGGPLMKFRVIESLLQLCGHGTHHRAQVLNMLRRRGVTPGSIDYNTWLRVRPESPAG